METKELNAGHPMRLSPENKPWKTWRAPNMPFMQRHNLFEILEVKEEVVRDQSLPTKAQEDQMDENLS